MTRVDAREVMDVYRLFHDLASVNPYGRPLEGARGPSPDARCACCGTPMNVQHRAGCLWLRAIRLYAAFAPIEDEPGYDPVPAAVPCADAHSGAENVCVWPECDCDRNLERSPCRQGWRKGGP